MNPVREEAAHGAQEGGWEYVWPDPRDRGTSAWLRMFSRLFASRDIVVQLIQRDLHVQYRQSFLGWLWLLILPVITVAFFSFLVGRRMLPIGDVPAPYPVYALWGVIVWQLFAGVLSACTQSLSAAGAMVTKVDFPKEALVIASVGRPLVEFSVKLVLVLGATYVLGGTLAWAAPAALLVLAPMVLLAVGAGFFLAILNLVARDVEGVVGIIASYGLFAAPILYPPPATFPFSLVNVLNPFSPFLIAIQDLLFRGRIDAPGIVALYTCVSVALFLLGWRFLHVALPRANG